MQSPWSLFPLSGSVRKWSPKSGWCFLVHLWESLSGGRVTDARELLGSEWVRRCEFRPRGRGRGTHFEWRHYRWPITGSQAVGRCSPAAEKGGCSSYSSATGLACALPGVGRRLTAASGRPMPSAALPCPVACQPASVPAFLANGALALPSRIQTRMHYRSRQFSDSTGAGCAQLWPRN